MIVALALAAAVLVPALAAVVALARSQERVPSRAFIGSAFGLVFWVFWVTALWLLWPITVVLLVLAWATWTRL